MKDMKITSKNGKAWYIVKTSDPECVVGPWGTDEVANVLFAIEQGAMQLVKDPNRGWVAR